MKLYPVIINLSLLKYHRKLEEFYDFLFKYGTKVIVEKYTDFIYTKENVEKEIKRIQSEKFKKYYDLINKSYYYSNQKIYDEKFLKNNLLPRKENIDRIIRESTNTVKEPSKTTFNRIDRFFVIPNDCKKDMILDYSIYNFDKKLEENFLSKYSVYYPRIDNEDINCYYIINEEQLIAKYKAFSETMNLYLTKEELDYLKVHNIYYICEEEKEKQKDILCEMERCFEIEYTDEELQYIIDYLVDNSEYVVLDTGEYYNFLGEEISNDLKYFCELEKKTEDEYLKQGKKTSFFNYKYKGLISEKEVDKKVREEDIKKIDSNSYKNFNIVEKYFGKLEKKENTYVDYLYVVKADKKFRENIGKSLWKIEGKEPENMIFYSKNGILASTLLDGFMLNVYDTLENANKLYDELGGFFNVYID